MSAERTGGRAAPRGTALGALLLALATLGTYAGVLGHAFVNYDDDTYVLDNAHVLDGLTAGGARWAFQLSGYAANWHPLTWLSHMLDVQLFGPAAGPAALENAVLHAAAAALLLVFLARATGALGASLFVAAAFALHPLRVESVAWVSERKEVLAGLLGMLALVGWERYALRPGAGRYALVAVALALGLLAKPTLVPLPLALLLLDVWPLGRWRWPAVRDGRPGAGLGLPRLFLEKLPLLLLSGASCVLTWIAQDRGEAISSTVHLGLGPRLANAALAVATYLGKLAWPARLACFYPHPWVLDRARPVLGPAVLAALALLLALSAAAVLARRSRPWLLVGWLWFLGWLVPVVGIVQVGSQALADRYTYLAGVGPALALAFEARAWAAHLPGLARPLAAAGGLLVAAWIPLSWRQVGTWRSSHALWEHALAVTERNHVAHQNLGNAYRVEGRLSSAAEEYRRAVEIRPDPDALSGYGEVLATLGRTEEAERVLLSCLRLEPDHPRAHANLALLLARRGDDEAARREFERALLLNGAPLERATIEKNLGHLALRARDPIAAEAHYRDALVLLRGRSDWDVVAGLGIALLDQGRRAEAETLLARAAEAAPRLALVQEGLRRLEEEHP